MVLFSPTPNGSIHATKQRQHAHKCSAFGPPPPLLSTHGCGVAVWCEFAVSFAIKTCAAQSPSYSARNKAIRTQRQSAFLLFRAKAIQADERNRRIVHTIALPRLFSSTSTTQEERKPAAVNRFIDVPRQALYSAAGLGAATSLTGLGRLFLKHPRMER